MYMYIYAVLQKMEHVRLAYAANLSCCFESCSFWFKASARRIAIVMGVLIAGRKYLCMFATAFPSSIYFDIRLWFSMFY